MIWFWREWFSCVIEALPLVRISLVFEACQVSDVEAVGRRWLSVAIDGLEGIVPELVVNARGVRVWVGDYSTGGGRVCGVL